MLIHPLCEVVNGYKDEDCDAKMIWSWTGEYEQIIIKDEVVPVKETKREPVSIITVPYTDTLVQYMAREISLDFPNNVVLYNGRKMSINPKYMIEIIPMEMVSYRYVTSDLSDKAKEQLNRPRYKGMHLERDRVKLVYPGVQLKPLGKK